MDSVDSPEERTIDDLPAEIEMCKKLKVLDLSINALRDDVAIGGALKTNTALTELEHRLMTLRTDLDARLARPPEPGRRRFSRSLARRDSVASIPSQVSQYSSLLGGTTRTLLRSTGRKQGTRES